MSRRRASLAPRDQAASTFSAILLRLCDATGALAAALVDREGESVDYAGFLQPYETRLSAAEWQLVIAIARRSRVTELQGVEQLVVRAAHRSYCLIALSDGYVLVLVLGRGCFRVSRRAVAEAVRELEVEAGLTYSTGPRSTGERWARVEVRTARNNLRRPESVWVNGAWQSVVILGRFHSSDLDRREVGYRARLPSGAEFALVREQLGRWFAEDL